MTNDTPTWTEIGAIAAAVERLISGADLSHDMLVELAGPLLRRLGIMREQILTDPHGDSDKPASRACHFNVAVVNNAESIPAWVRDLVSGDDFDENVDFLDRYDGERSLMFVDFDGDVQVEADGGEAEDNTFARDWHWVEAAIRRAYELGVKHGAASAS